MLSCSVICQPDYNKIYFHFSCKGQVYHACFPNLMLSIQMLQEHHCNSLQEYKEDECRYTTLNYHTLCLRETFPPWKNVFEIRFLRKLLSMSKPTSQEFVFYKKSPGAHATTWWTGGIVGDLTNFGMTPGLANNIGPLYKITHWHYHFFLISSNQCSCVCRCRNSGVPCSTGMIFNPEMCRLELIIWKLHILVLCFISAKYDPT